MVVLPESRPDRVLPAGVAVVPAAADDLIRELYRLHGQPLYGFLLRLAAGRRHPVEELLQETMLRAARSLDDRSPDLAMLRPWLFTVARHVAVEAGRARTRRPVEVDAGDIGALSRAGKVADTSVALETVRTALDRLRPEHRTVLVELYCRGRSAYEIAQLLGVPEDTVKSRAFHAVRALHETLDRHRPAANDRRVTAHR